MKAPSNSLFVLKMPFINIPFSVQQNYRMHFQYSKLLLKSLKSHASNDRLMCRKKTLLKHLQEQGMSVLNKSGQRRNIAHKGTHLHIQQRSQDDNIVNVSL